MFDPIQYKRVRLITDRYEKTDGQRYGAVGVVLECYPDNWFEIEFCEEGDPTFTSTCIVAHRKEFTLDEPPVRGCLDELNWPVLGGFGEGAIPHVYLSAAEMLQRHSRTLPWIFPWRTRWGGDLIVDSLCREFSLSELELVQEWGFLSRLDMWLFDRVVEVEYGKVELHGTLELTEVKSRVAKSIVIHTGSFEDFGLPDEMESSVIGASTFEEVIRLVDGRS